MNYLQLKDYLSEKMRLSHIYQPLFIRTILESKRPVPTREIAKQFLGQDESQIEYYENITKIMPAKVLKKNGVISETAEGYVIKGDHSLTASQRKELIEVCDRKIAEYKEKRGKKIWQHRRLGARAVPGSLRFRVLKNAGFRCELCGISADEKALEVDHIVPRNLGGPSDEENYQALCYTCNSQKRDTDSTDFREWKSLYKKHEKECVFCCPEKSRVIEERNLAYLLVDKHPASEGHVLAIPRRHVASTFELFKPELNACMALIEKYAEQLKSKDRTIEGFNIGVNIGEAAGQTVFHCHWHLIPRRKGDVENPRGGVRHCIPGKGDYLR